MVDIQAPVVDLPARQPGLQQLRQAAADGALGDHPAPERRQRGGGGKGLQRQSDGEFAAVTEPGTDLQLALHHFAELTGQGQAQAGAAVLAGDAGVGLGEGLEDALQGVRGDADAGIAHADAHSAGDCFGTHIDAPQTGELEGVGEQVADHLAHSRGVAAQLGRQLRADQAGQFHARRGVLRQQAGGVLDQQTEVEWNVLQLELAGLELRQVEHVVEQLDQHLARVVGDG
ncbi:hypothetical protein D9M71_335520 [compost metagenome]